MDYQRLAPSEREEIRAPGLPWRWDLNCHAYVEHDLRRQRHRARQDGCARYGHGEIGRIPEPVRVKVKTGPRSLRAQVPYVKGDGLGIPEVVPPGLPQPRRLSSGGV
jgi:hypothetical protein